MTFFSDILSLERQIKDNDKKRFYEGVSAGIVSHIHVNGSVRVQPLDQSTQYVSYWLQPTSFMHQHKDQLRLGLVTLYCFPELNIESGYYFAIINPEYQIKSADGGGNGDGGYTEAEIKAWINAAVTAESTLIRAWVSGQNYTTLAAVQTWVSGQNFTTLAAVQTWVNAQNFALASNVISPLNVWRYNVNYFFQGSKGNNAQISDQYADRHVTLMCLGSRLPTTGGTQDAAPVIGMTLDGGGAGLEQRFDIGTEIFLRINTTARIHVMWFNNITLNGVLSSGTVANTGTLMPLRTSWKLNKTAAKTWTLINLDNFNYVPFN